MLTLSILFVSQFTSNLLVTRLFTPLLTLIMTPPPKDNTPISQQLVESPACPVLAYIPFNNGVASCTVASGVDPVLVILTMYAFAPTEVTLAHSAKICVFTNAIVPDNNMPK